uniref:Uncharacterized protein n=1 Tax=Oryza sativa subsp. japonica TaxID=39947 RepID=Q6Z1K1_ORYSJ|nr:hypothetical protein [Oryza sativa Japonica Group]
MEPASQVGTGAWKMLTCTRSKGRNRYFQHGEASPFLSPVRGGGGVAISVCEEEAAAAAAPGLGRGGVALGSGGWGGGGALGSGGWGGGGHVEGTGRGIKGRDGGRVEE